MRVKSILAALFLEILRGHSYIIKLKVCPTYLYMLSEPDLNNPTLMIE